MMVVLVSEKPTQKLGVDLIGGNVSVLDLSVWGIKPPFQPRGGGGGLMPRTESTLILPPMVDLP